MAKSIYNGKNKRYGLNRYHCIDLQDSRIRKGKFPVESDSRQKMAYRTPSKIITSKKTRSLPLLSLIVWKKKLPFFKVCSKVGAMCLPNDGIVKQVKSRGISLCAKGSGIASFATNGNINAPIAQTASSRHCLTAICSIILQEKTSGGVM